VRMAPDPPSRKTRATAPVRVSAIPLPRSRRGPSPSGVRRVISVTPFRVRGHRRTAPPRCKVRGRSRWRPPRTTPIVPRHLVEDRWNSRSRVGTPPMLHGRQASGSWIALPH
jgi:hypothetical protein